MRVPSAISRARHRLDLSRAKPRSLTGHARVAHRVASLVPFYGYDGSRPFRADDLPDSVAARRRAGFAALSALYEERFARTRAPTTEASAGLSNLQFTSACRVPFQFSRHVRAHLGAGFSLREPAGVTVSDLDGNASHDLAGSYGVNLFGTDYYRGCRTATARGGHGRCG